MYIVCDYKMWPQRDVAAICQPLSKAHNGHFVPQDPTLLLDFSLVLLFEGQIFVWMRSRSVRSPRINVRLTRRLLELKAAYRSSKNVVCCLSFF